MIPLTRPFVDHREAEAAAAVVACGWLTQGARVEEFEQAVAAYVGAAHAVATSSCTAALQLALLAAGVRPGDEVICPSLTFIATPNAILHAGGVPVFVDIDRDTYNLDPALVEAAITPRTRAIMPVDQVGLAADIPAIVDIARRHGLAVVEDAAPALGATVDGQRVGSLSHFTCFSFHPRKVITTGEGGMVTTNDGAAAARLRAMRSHGVSVSDFDRHRTGTFGTETYEAPGFNYRLTDIQAAVGVVQMSKLELILARRRALADDYARLLAGDSRVTVPAEPDRYRHTYQSYCVRLRDTRVAAASVVRGLDQRGVSARRGVMACHLQPAYRKLYPRLSLPETEAAANETLLLPLFPDLSAGEQLQVVEGLAAALDHGR